jgi:phosphoribosylformylglycinamidine cyclo-ligase
LKTPRKQKAYAAAGVDVDLGNTVKKGIHALVSATHGPEVLGKIGGFGGLFRPDFRGMKDPVLVSSVDGVGTKLKIAFATNRHDTIGQDLVNHCINDIAVIGARPLFFLDYIGGEKLDPVVFRQILKGFAKACKDGGCALIGGETAEMPGMYAPGHYDLAGFCVGAVERERIVDPTRIREGDLLVGIPSSGPHSNGYSLIRKLVAGLDLQADPGGFGCTLAEALLAPTRIYVKELLALHAEDLLLGAAHITGGGFTGNVPRMLPPGFGSVIRAGSWPVPPIFSLLRTLGQLNDDEMYRTFNNGLGMILTVRPEVAVAVAARVGGYVVGEVVRDDAGECRVVE